MKNPPRLEFAECGEGNYPFELWVHLYELGVHVLVVEDLESFAVLLNFGQHFYLH